MEAGANKFLLVMGSKAGGGQRPGAGDLKHRERVTTYLTQEAEIATSAEIATITITITIKICHLSCILDVV